MSYQEIEYDVSDRIATITLNRPERMNAFSEQMLGEWADAIRRSQDDDGVREIGRAHV